MRFRLLGAAGVLVALLSAGACAKTLDTAELEDMLTDQVEAQFELTGITIACPEGVEAEAGGTFQCSVANGGGIAEIRVTQTNDDGDLTWEVVPEAGEAAT